MAWNWMGGASEWIFQSRNVPTLQLQESIWGDRLIMEEEEAAAGGAGTETPTTTVAMNATRDMRNTTTDITTGALLRPTTVDTGPAHVLAHTAHDDIELLLSAFIIPSISDCVRDLWRCFRGIPV